MANPLTIAGIGMGAAGGGSILGAIGSLFTGQAQANMYQYQAGVAQLNQQIEQQNASYALAVGEVEAQQSSFQTAGQIGQTKATQGAGNIAVGRDSAGAVVGSEVEIGAENQAIIRAGAQKQAYGSQVAGFEQSAQAGLYGAAASTSLTAGDIGAASSILGGASSVSSKWLQASQAGVYGGGPGGGSGGSASYNYDAEV